MSFGNPAGAWALLALLAVLAIHTLQRRRRRHVVSSSFLLGAQTLPVRGGRWLERLRRSPSLWLQLAAAALLIWLLLEPRWLREDSAQRVVLVLDSTASMSAFREPAEAALRRVLPLVEREVAHTEWVVLETAPQRPTLYSGTSREELEEALADWDPSLGAHDFDSAIGTARQLAGGSGRVVLVTDHDAMARPGLERLIVGQPLDNVGFAGLAVQDADTTPRWRALVKSYASSGQRRRLHVESGGLRRELEPVELAPGEVQAVSGGFPDGSDSLELVLDGDAFSLDDRLPIVRPQPKPLTVALDSAARESDLVSRLLGSLPAVAPTAEPGTAALEIRLGTGQSTAAHAVVLAPEPSSAPRGAIAAMRHPLVDDLGWLGLIPGQGAGLVAAPGDEVLVWYGRRPLLVLRSRADGGQELRLGISLASSNAERHPALPLLLHRFAERARAASLGYERRNLTTHAALEIALDPDGPPPRRSAEGTPAGDYGDGLRAPGRPGLFEVRQGEQLLLSAAARFADVREADLSGASSIEELSAAGPQRLAASSRADPLAPVWLLLAGALMCLDWAGGRPEA